MQTVAAASEYLPAAQTEQLLAPVALEKKPAPQLVHVDDATADAYIACGQLVQTVAAVVEYMPATQDKQLLAPVVPRYVPAVQLVQADAPDAE